MTPFNQNILYLQVCALPENISKKILFYLLTIVKVCGTISPTQSPQHCYKANSDYLRYLPLIMQATVAVVVDSNGRLFSPPFCGLPSGVGSQNILFWYMQPRQKLVISSVPYAVRLAPNARDIGHGKFDVSFDRSELTDNR